jgi:hypothetical protein
MQRKWGETENELSKARERIRGLEDHANSVVSYQLATEGIRDEEISEDPDQPSASGATNLRPEPKRK